MHKQLLQITLPNLCTPFLWVYLVFVSLCLSLYIYILYSKWEFWSWRRGEGSRNAKRINHDLKLTCKLSYMCLCLCFCFIRSIPACLVMIIWSEVCLLRILDPKSLIIWNHCCTFPCVSKNYLKGSFKVIRHTSFLLSNLLFSLYTTIEHLWFISVFLVHEATSTSYMHTENKR